MTRATELSFFLENKELKPEQKEEIKKTALETLGLCHNAEDMCSQKKTILCVGYVQSGKTTSFEAVIAAGKDQKHKLFIVLAGGSKNLLKQSTDRIIDDFRLNDLSLSRRWIRFTNPNSTNASELPDLIKELNDEDEPHEKAIIINPNPV